MQPLFENRYVGTLPILMEYIRKVMLRDLLRASAIGIALTMGMALCLAIVGNTNSALLAGVFCLAFVLTYFIAPMIPMYRILRASQDAYGDEEVETQITFSDKIHVAEGTESVSLDYSQIVGIRELRGFYALEIDELGAVIVARGGFTTGKEEEFLPFLKEHCSRIRTIKK